MYNYKRNSGEFETSFIVNCIKVWNALPLNIKALPYTNRNNALKIFKNSGIVVTD